MNEEINEEDYAGLAQEYNNLKQAKDQMGQELYRQTDAFTSERESNLIKWQLDLKEDFDRISHRLRGDVEEYNEDGVSVWKENIDPELQTFNAFGVDLVMNILSFYLNRNTVLSNFSEQIINETVYNISHEINDLIFCRYEDMMLTIKQEEGEAPEDFALRKKNHLADKIKMYPVIVYELSDSIHAAYLRAYHGGERESLRTARMVTQNQALVNPNVMPQQMGAMSRKRKWYNPITWTG